MAETPVSLFDRLQRQPSEADWQRLVALYTPLLRDWLSRVPGLRSEVDDLVQDILRCLVTTVPEFQRQRTGSFRRWLRVTLANRVRLHWRKNKGRVPVRGEEAERLLNQIADPDDPIGRVMDVEHHQHVLSRLTELIEPEFRPETWLAFRRHVLDGHSPAVVARELGISENAVLVTRCRVLKRLREEARGIID